jgi:hypothetical protein
MAKAAFNKKKNLFTCKLDLNLRKKLVKCYIWCIALCGAEAWTLRKADQKYLESFEMWCWRRMEKISWTNRVRNEEVLHRVKEERIIPHTVKGRKAKWICHIKYVIEEKLEGRIEMTVRRERIRRQLLDDLKEKRRYWKLKEEALIRTLWRTRFGRDYRSVVIQTTEWMNGAFPLVAESCKVLAKCKGNFGSSSILYFGYYVKYICTLKESNILCSNY